MTLICVDAQPDHATIVGDGLAYDPTGMQFWEHPDKRPGVLEHIDAAVISAGNVHAGYRWRTETAPLLAAEVADFDEFATRAERALAAEFGDAHELQVLMVGYSPARERFVGYVAWPLMGTGWTLQPFTGVHLDPAPKGTQPTAAENAWLASVGVTSLPDGQPLASPQTVDEWRSLIRRAYRDRALADPYAGDGAPKRMFGGDITLTRVERGQVASTVVDRLDDPDDFREMVRYTLHPLGQVGPCPCQSGRRMIDCGCIGGIVDKPCLCGSGATFGECHKVDADTATVAA